MNLNFCFIRAFQTWQTRTAGYINLNVALGILCLYCDKVPALLRPMKSVFSLQHWLDQEKKIKKQVKTKDFRKSVKRKYLYACIDTHIYTNI